MTRRTLTAIVFTLSSLATACGWYEPYTKGEIRIVPGTSDEDIEMVVHAADQWREATGGVVDLQPVVAERDAMHMSIRFAEADARDSGATQHGQMLIDNTLPHAWRAVTVMHEMGHAAGADDPSHTETGLMRSNWGLAADAYQEPCVDEAALDWLAAAIGTPAYVRAYWHPTCTGAAAPINQQ
jgi:hypothetical protein